MDLSIEHIQHAGLTLEIGYDPFPHEVNPREDDGNIGVMLCGHRHYRLGDEQADETFSPLAPCVSCAGSGYSPTRFELMRLARWGWTCVGAGSSAAMQGERQVLVARAELVSDERGRQDADRLAVEPARCPACDGGGQIELPIDRYLKQERGASVILPLGLIDHSGISMYVGAGAHSSDPGGWDSGQVGVIFDTTETRAACGLEDAPRDEIERQLRGEVAIYDRYLRGAVYAYKVIAADGSVIDALGGFLGDLDEVIAAAKDAATSGAASHT